MAYPYDPTGTIPGTLHTATRTKEQVFDQLNRMSKDNHFKMETVLWYKTLTDTNTTVIRENRSRNPRNKSPAKGREFVQRLLALFYFNGVFIRRNDEWKLWNTTNMPICAVLSHGGRVMIQISHHHNCWPYLWGKDNESDANEVAKEYKRAASTHSVGLTKSHEVIDINGYYCKKGIMELKGGIKTGFKKVASISATKGRKAAGLSGQHYGINVAMGGTGNYNPFSGNQISANGSHGHLYIYYAPPTETKYGGLLIGLEDSAAPDVGPETTGQTFHSHGIGSTEEYLATGGKKWDSKRNPENGVNERDWHEEGPLNRYGSLFVDLVGTRMTRLKGWCDGFDPSTMLGWHGHENSAYIRLPRDTQPPPHLLTKKSPEWQKDSAYRICHHTSCTTRLKMRHRHHCRICGHIFCDEHCPKREEGVRGTISGSVRICTDCYQNLIPLRERWTADSHGRCESCETALRKGKRHHCRNCGILVCDKCSKKQFVIPDSGSNKKQRVCDECYDSLR